MLILGQDIMSAKVLNWERRIPMYISRLERKRQREDSKIK